MNCVVVLYNLATDNCIWTGNTQLTVQSYLETYENLTELISRIRVRRSIRLYKERHSKRGIQKVCISTPRCSTLNKRRTSIIENKYEKLLFFYSVRIFTWAFFRIECIRLLVRFRF